MFYSEQSDDGGYLVTFRLTKVEYEELINLVRDFKHVIGVHESPESLVREAVLEYMTHRRAWMSKEIEELI